MALGMCMAACASGGSESSNVGEEEAYQRVDLARLSGWIGGAEPPEEVLTARAVLVRWWTDTCSYCERSLPALDSLGQKYGEDGLVVVGVYHPKPRGRAFLEGDILRTARGLGFSGPIALDPDWSLLHEAWLDFGGRRATSVSFLLDTNGQVRHVHPGPELHPSDDPSHAGCRRGFDAMERAVSGLLGV